MEAQAEEMSFAAGWGRVGEGATRGGCDEEGAIVIL